jgi:hypothetical protein
MKTLRGAIVCLVVLFSTVSLLRAQDLSKYRHFTLGMSVTKLLERTDEKMSDVKTIHGRPALIQEVTWWPPSGPGSSFRSDGVEQVLFSFYNGELYKISVTYDPPFTAGLTEEDMVKSISAKYGPATIVAPEIDSPAKPAFNSRQRSVAYWEDAQYSVNLVRSYFSDVLGLVVFSKPVNTQAELAIGEAAKLDEQEGPKREADRQKKQKDDLEAARQKNQKSFRP